jgi:NTE family protein
VVASDLYAPEGAAPGSLDGSALRAQDLAFSVQVRTRLEALQRERGLIRRIEPGAPSAILLHLIHRPPAHQRALKALDYSGTAIEERAGQGRADFGAMLARLTSASRSKPLELLTLPHE